MDSTMAMADGDTFQPELICVQPEAMHTEGNLSSYACSLIARWVTTLPEERRAACGAR